MVHFRIVVPEDSAKQALDLLCAADSVLNVIHIPAASKKPKGDVILCDVAREDASVIISDLKELDIPTRGSIAVEMIDTELSDAAIEAEKAAPGLPSDAVIWEEVESRASENTELSISFVIFMLASMQISAVGIVLNQPVLIIGGMVVSPEFGPLAALCVALVQRRTDFARRSLIALAVGFPLGIAGTFVTALIFKALGLFDDGFSAESHPLTQFVFTADWLSFIVAFVAGAAGVLSLTNAKSGALVGVLISVTTIPAAAGIGLAAAYGEWTQVGGATKQLAVNLVALILSGLLTLYVQHRYYLARKRKHKNASARAAAGLPGEVAKGEKPA